MAIVPVPPESTRKEQVTKPLPWLSGVKETVNYTFSLWHLGKKVKKEGFPHYQLHLWHVILEKPLTT